MNAHVVEQAGGLEQETLALGERVLVLEHVEQLRREERHVPAMRAIEAEAVAERFRAREHLVLEVAGGRLRLGLGEVDQHADRSDASETMTRRAAVSVRIVE
ncbi:MAG: hypothetical protein QM736_29980 [Vicinamibacterales bacterium]